MSPTPLAPHELGTPRGVPGIRSGFYPVRGIHSPGGNPPNPLNALQNPSAGRGNPITPDVLVARQTGAVDLNPTVLPGQTWFPISVDRPTIVVPKDTLQFTQSSVTTNQNGVGLIYYTPNRQATDLGTVGNGNVQKSARHGVVYLPNPGRWWLYYNRSSTNLAVIQIDASDPSVAARYLTEPGVHLVRTTTFAAGTFLAATLVLEANRDRVAATFQNTGTGDLRIGFTIGVTAITGFKLIGSQTTSITFSGDTCWKGPIYAIDASAGTAVLMVAEYV